MRVSRILFVMLVSAVVGTAASTAHAQVAEPPGPGPQQPASTRPYRGIFGGGMGETGQSLTVSGSLGTGFQTDVYAAFRGDTPSNSGTQQPPTRGTFGFGSGSANYSLARGPVSFGAAGSTTAYVYRQDGRRVLRSYSGTATQGFELSRRTRLSASQFANYQPFELNRLFPGLESSIGAPDLPMVDSFIGSQAYLSWGAAIDISRQFTRRISAQAGYGTNQSGWSGGHTTQEGRASMSVAIANGLGLRLGYGYGQARYATDETSGERLVRNHVIDAGVDYSRSLSISRRTTLSFSTGSTAIRDRQQTHFRLTGQAQLARAIGRSWSLGARYVRNVQYAEQLREVLFTDGLNVFVGGLLNRRQTFHAAAGMSNGDVGFGSTRNGALATHATVGVVTAINRFVGLGTDYSYYLHSFGEDVLLPRGILREVDRHSVRLYVSLWAPLIAEARSLDAAR